MKRILDYDPLSGITTWFDYEPATDTTLISREQDVEPLLDQNKEFQNDEDYSRKGIKGGWWHYATIPNMLIEKWLFEEGIDVFNKDHDKKVFAKLNAPEYRYLKTTTKMHRG